MVIQASQLIANLGGRAAARNILRSAPVGTEYIGQYCVGDKPITHYYDSRFRLYQDQLWAYVGVQQLATLQNNSLFTVFYEFRAVFNALEVLPAEPAPESESSCSKCSTRLDQLTLCRSNVTRLTKESIALNNGQYWWRFFALAVICIIALDKAGQYVKAGQWWLL